MEDVITIATNLSTKGFEKGSKALRQAINSLSRSATQLGRSTARSATSLLGTFKRLLPMLIGVGSAYQIISKAVSAFMSQNEELSSKMNSIWTALGNLIAPIMEQIINWITTAVSYFLEFLRLLGVTGKTASQLSQKANKSVQELRKTIAGFDELNILQDNSGNNNNNKDAHLDDVNPSEWMRKLADLFKNKMWDDAADMIIDKMNKIIYTIRDKAQEVGEKVGEYLRGIIHVIARVLDEVDWKQLGVAFANFFNGLVPEAEALTFGEDLGKILVAKFTIAFKILTGFLEDPGWPNRVADILSGMIIGAFDSVANAILGADFQQIGANIRAFFERLWDNKDEIADAIFGALKAAWDGALDLLWGLLSGGSEEEPPIVRSIRNLGEKVMELVQDILPTLQDFWETRLKPEVDKLVNETIPGIIDMISSVIGWLDKFIEKHPETAVDLLNVAFTTLVGIEVAGFFGKVAAGAKDAIKPVSDLVKLLGGGAGASGASTAAAAGSGVAGAAGAAEAATGGLALSFGTVASALSGGLLAALGVLPFILVGNKKEAEYVAQAFEDAGGTAEGMAEKMNILAENASHYEECLYDTTGYTTELGYSMATAQYSATAYNEMLVALAEQLGITTEELKAQIEAAGGDVTQIEALKNSTSGLNQSNIDTANSQEQLNTAMDETATHIQGAADSATVAAENFVNANNTMQQAASDTDSQADASYTNVEATVTEKSGNAASAVSTDSQAMDTDTQTAFTNMETTVSTSMGVIEQSVTAGFDSVKSAASDGASQVQQVATAAFSAMSTDVSASMSEMSANVTTSLQELSASTAESATNMSSSFTETISQMGTDAVSYVSEAASSMVDILGQLENDVAAAAQNISVGFASGISNLPDSARESTHAAVEVANEELGGLGEAGGEWGADMMAQFTLAIQRALFGLEIQLQQFTQMIRDYIHFSEPDVGPLSDFHTYAPDMMKLFTQGIIDGQKDVMKAASNVAEGVSEQFLGSSDGLEDLGNNLQMIENIKNRVHYRTPGVAGGGLVPYSVSDAAVNAESANSSYQSVMEQNDRIMDVLGRILDAIMEGKVIAVDKYKFGELLVKTLSNEARARGKSLL